MNFYKVSLSRWRWEQPKLTSTTPWPFTLQQLKSSSRWPRGEWLLQEIVISGLLFFWRCTFNFNQILLLNFDRLSSWCQYWLISDLMKRRIENASVRHFRSVSSMSPVVHFGLRRFQKWHPPHWARYLADSIASEFLAFLEYFIEISKRVK